MRLKLLLPLSPLSLNQNFGEDNACYNPFTREVRTRTDVVCPVGFRSLYQNMKGHNGLDLRATDWQPIYAASEGFVEELQTEPERGLGIGIISNLKYDFILSPYSTSGEFNAKTRYWHLAAFNVKKGDQVKAGQLIGWADNTGYSSGTHLHFELKPVYEKDGRWHNLFQDNGFYGAIDPTVYLEMTPAFDKNSFLMRIRLQVADIMNKMVDLLTKVGN